ncbi:MAG: hypothetical protein GSR77_05785 [Desulfurococcales archaeon]|nr:hypothetical protein [Desulfurococcales archaeon]
MDEYSVSLYDNGSRAYTEKTTLPATIVVKHGGIEYRLSLELPKPPVLNQMIEPELEPVDTMPLPLPNGTVINTTVYRVNETITIDVFGDTALKLHRKRHGSRDEPDNSRVRRGTTHIPNTTRRQRTC